MRCFLALLVAALVLTSTAEAQQGQRRAATGASSGRKMRDTAAPQSGSPVGVSQNSTLGIQALRPPTKPNYQPPVKPRSAPRQREVGGSPVAARTRGQVNPFAGHDRFGSYARRAPVGGRRLRSQNSRTVQENLLRNLTQFSNNQTINNRFAAPRGSR